MQINFQKMHALGNDFVIIDSLQQDIQLSTENIKFIADRHIGIGCDQVLCLYPSKKTGIDVNYIIYNADGSEVAQCGNGARCIAAYLWRTQEWQDKKEITVATLTETISIYLQPDNQIRVNMGVPKLAPKDIPIQAKKYAKTYMLKILEQTIECSAVSMGNPHAVIKVNDIISAPVSAIGQAMQQQEFFPDGINIGFMQIINNKYIKLRVYERGAGETKACGSGACAAVVTGAIAYNLEQKVTVELTYGNITIDWEGEKHPVWMTGPATFVYNGNISL